MLQYEMRIEIPVSNTRVFGHGGIYHQVHNEVYEWLRLFSEGTDWYERSIRTGMSNRVTAKLFYFANKKVAMAFKLAWGGKQ